MIKRIILTTLPLLYLVLNANAGLNRDSINTKTKLTDRVSISANIGGFYQNNNYYLLANPMIVYQATKKLYFGAGPYFSVNGNTVTNIFNKTYGVNAMSRYILVNNFFAQAQFDMLNYKFGTGREWNTALLVGGGYIASGISFQVLYNVFHDPNNSPYGNSPWIIQGGFGIRL